MKKYMMLDDALPVKHPIPLHPDTGQPWRERYDEIVEISLEMAEGNPHAAAKRAELIAVTTFRDEPYLIEILPQVRPVGDDSKVFSCHPDTWAATTDEVKSGFILIDMPGKPESMLIEIPFQRPELN